jgi:guanosine-3',5'-bis(diphosphate) 3'-pyrophosphohydrolase
VGYRDFAFAAQWHREQRRKDARATPYINHPVAIAATRPHDTIEDTETTCDELRGPQGR